MEILKKILILVIFVSSFSFLSAQNSTQDIIDAFAKSYQAENSGNYSQAINSLKIVYNENSYEINLRLGWLSYSLGNFSQSVSYYNKAVSLMPYSIEAKMGLIYPLYATGKTSQVVNLYKEILVISPNYYSALYNLGNIYYAQAKYAEALKLFKKLADLFPFDYDTLLMYAWTNYQLKKYREAGILFNKVLMIQSDDESALQGLKLME